LYSTPFDARSSRPAIVVAVLAALAAALFAVLPNVMANAAPERVANVTNTTQQSSYGIWSDSVVPDVLNADETNSVTLGLDFSSSTDGLLYGIQYYAAGANRIATTGHVWKSNGRKIASVSFPTASENGWKTAWFSSPVRIRAGVKYTASYRAPVGRYSTEEGVFSNSTNLTANGLTAYRGTYVYGTGRPTNTWHGSNYFVDLAFAPTSDSTPTPTPEPTPTPTPTSDSTPTATPTPTPTEPTPTPTESTPTPTGWPNETNTGVPGGTVLTDYTGPCTITTANTVIDSKTINCVEFQIATTGVVVKNSKINGVVRVGTQDDYEPTTISDPEGDDPIRITILDSEIDATAAAGRGFRPIQSSHYIVRRSYLHGAGSGAECHNACTITNSYVHGFGEHASGMRILRNGTLRNNTIWCEPNPNSDDDNDGVIDVDGGCSGDLTMYEEFGVPHNNLVEGNYFPAGLFWYSLKFNGNDDGDIRIVDNLFGVPKPGAGVADGWDVKATNVWSGNTFTNGQVANP